MRCLGTGWPSWRLVVWPRWGSVTTSGSSICTGIGSRSCVEQQRNRLAKSQYKSLNSELLVATTDELRTITKHWLLHNDNTDTLAHSIRNNAADATPIIPVNIEFKDLSGLYLYFMTL